MTKEFIFPKLSDVDEALQVEKDLGIDLEVLERVRKMIKKAEEFSLHTETLPTEDGGMKTILTS